MTYPNPNCTVMVHFDEFNSSFAFSRESSSSGWQVDVHGNISPPAPARIIQFSLRGAPEDVRFAAFQLCTSPAKVPPRVDRWPDLPEGVTALAPEPYPKDDETTFGPLVFDFDSQSTQLYYRLAVQVGDGPLHWHDPKIYDDGSDFRVIAS